MGFLQQLTVKKKRRQNDGYWCREVSNIVLQKAGVQPIQTYIDLRQATTAECMDFWPIFKVCVEKTGYKGGGSHFDMWWRQAEANKQIRAILEEIFGGSEGLVATRIRQTWRERGMGGGDRL